MATKCSVCGQENVRWQRQRYCFVCHAAYMRTWRKTHPMSADQKRKDSARSYANVYKKRGVLKAQPCEVCRATDVEMHHDDYSKPLEVRWFCRHHHLEGHIIGYLSGK